ncbi:MAG: HlyD family efflux transporter periplasmic adaptor subunit [Chloroflexi bacterium]|nr:HlyD family efflux transporter periplasmic adaptor subunit [Chloroflexota bacterium]
MNKKQTIVGLVVIVAMIAIGSFAYQKFGAAQDVAAAAETVVDDGQTVMADTAVQTAGSVVSAEGVISPLRSANLSFLIGGQVAEIVAEEGSVVAVGDPIMRLTAADLELGVQQAQAGVTTAEAALTAAQAQLALAQAQINSAEIGVTAAQAQLDLVKAGPRPEEIAAAEKNIAAAEAGIAQAAGGRDAALHISDAQIRGAEAEVAAATAELRSIQDGYDAIIDACFKMPDGSEVCPLYGPTEENTRAQLEISQLQLSAAQEGLNALQAGPTSAQRQAAGGAVALAVANRDLTQAQLDLLLAGATDEQIRQAEVGVEQAELGVEQASTAVAQAEASVTQAEAGVIQTQAGLAAAQKALERMTLTAPFAGTIVSIMTNEGELASSGVPVVVLADMSEWLVETTDLTELDVAAIAVGDATEVRIDAIDDELLSGTVTEIATVSTLTRGDVTYAVTVQLDANTLPLRWGMTAFVDVGE